MILATDQVPTTGVCFWTVFRLTAALCEEKKHLSFQGGVGKSGVLRQKNTGREVEHGSAFAVKHCDI